MGSGCMRPLFPRCFGPPLLCLLNPFADVYFEHLCLNPLPTGIAMTRGLQCPRCRRAAKTSIGVAESLQLNPTPNVHSPFGPARILPLGELVLEGHKYLGGIENCEERKSSNRGNGYS